MDSEAPTPAPMESQVNNTPLIVWLCFIFGAAILFNLWLIYLGKKQDQKAKDLEELENLQETLI